MEVKQLGGGKKGWKHWFNATDVILNPITLKDKKEKEKLEKVLFSSVLVINRLRGGST